MNKSNIVLSFILSKSLFFGLGISYIISNANKNSGLAIIIGYLLGALLIYFIKKKKISIIISILLIIITYIIILLAFTIQTTNFYLPNSPSLLIALSFLLVIIYGSSKKYNSYKRLVFLLFMISICLTILGIIGNIPNIKFNNYLPLF